MPLSVSSPGAISGRPLLLQQLPVEKLAVFRALQLGDMLCAVPALRALRHALPHAWITLVGLPWSLQFTQRFACYVDEFIAFPGHPGFPEQPVQAYRTQAFYQQMQARRFDLALQMHGSGEISNRVISAFGARLMAGFVPRAEAVTDSRCFLAYPENGAEPLRLLQLAAHLGASGCTPALEFPIGDQDRDALRGTAFAARLVEGDYLCIHPGARNREKCWPPQRFAEVADTLAEEFGLQVVLTGSPAETDLTAAVAARMRTPSIDAAGPLSIGTMAALMQGARLLVCNDTGVSHIAAGMKLPSVVVFSTADMQRWAPLDQNLHRCLRDPQGLHAPQVLAQARELLTQVRITAGTNPAPAPALRPPGRHRQS